MSEHGMQDRTVALIAEALLDAGVLSEDGYAGSLRDSVTVGLRCWLSESGAENLSFFDNLNLAWTDDTVSTHGIQDEGGWAFGICQINRQAAEQIDLSGQIARDKHLPIGGFALIACDGMSRSVVGPRIEALMAVIGRKTAWRVLRVLQTALYVSGIATTPAEVRQMPAGVLGTDEDWAGAEAEQHDIMTTERFDRKQPVEACEFMRHSDPRLLRRARANLRRRFNREYHEWGKTGEAPRAIVRAGFPNPEHAFAYNVVAVAADLGTLIEGYYFADDSFSDTAAFDPAPIPAHLMRWSLCDNVGRVFDDYVEYITGYEQATTIVSVIPFLVDLPGDGRGTLANAVRRMRELIPIVTLSDALIDLLNEEDADADDGGEGVWPPGTNRPGEKGRRLPIPLSDRRTQMQEYLNRPRTLIEMLADRGAEGPRTGMEALRAQQQHERAAICRL